MRHGAVLKGLIFLSSLFLCLTQGCSETGYVWNEGFLEKVYSADEKDWHRAEFKLTERWLGTDTTSDRNSGYVTSTYRTADGHVQIKWLRKGDKLVSVAIKCGEGDKECSRQLHTKLHEIPANPPVYAKVELGANVYNATKEKIGSVIAVNTRVPDPYVVVDVTTGDLLRGETLYLDERFRAVRLSRFKIVDDKPVVADLTKETVEKLPKIQMKR